MTGDKEGVQRDAIDRWLSRGGTQDRRVKWVQNQVVDRCRGGFTVLTITKIQREKKGKGHSPQKEEQHHEKEVPATHALEANQTNRRIRCKQQRSRLHN